MPCVLDAYHLAFVNRGTVADPIVSRYSKCPSVLCELTTADSSSEPLQPTPLVDTNGCE